MGIIEQNIRTAARKKGLTIKQLAKQAEVTDQSIYRMFKKDDYKFQTLVKFHKILNVDFYEMVGIPAFETSRPAQNINDVDDDTPIDGVYAIFEDVPDGSSVTEEEISKLFDGMGADYIGSGVGAFRNFHPNINR